MSISQGARCARPPIRSLCFFCLFVCVCVCLSLCLLVSLFANNKTFDTHKHRNGPKLRRWFFSTYTRSDSSPFRQGLYLFTLSELGHSFLFYTHLLSLKTIDLNLYMDRGKMRRHNAPKHCGDNSWMLAPRDHGKPLSMKVI